MGECQPLALGTPRAEYTLRTVYDCAWNPDGTRIASSMADGRAVQVDPIKPMLKVPGIYN